MDKKELNKLITTQSLTIANLKEIILILEKESSIFERLHTYYKIMKSLIIGDNVSLTTLIFDELNKYEEDKLTIEELRFLYYSKIIHYFKRESFGLAIRTYFLSEDLGLEMIREDLTIFSLVSLILFNYGFYEEALSFSEKIHYSKFYPNINILLKLILLDNEIIIASYLEKNEKVSIFKKEFNDLYQTITKDESLKKYDLHFFLSKLYLANRKAQLENDLESLKNIAEDFITVFKGKNIKSEMQIECTTDSYLSLLKTLQLFNKHEEIIYTIEELLETNFPDTRDRVNLLTIELASLKALEHPLYFERMDEYSKVLHDYFQKNQNLMIDNIHRIFDIQKLKNDYNEKIKNYQRDSLTGAYTRQVFDLTAPDFFNITQKGSLIFFDLNDLKMINDTQGHSMGDFYLSRLARIILDNLDSGKLFRYGGDEFVLLSHIDNKKLIDSFFKKVQTSINKMFETSPKSSLSFSSGVAIYGKNGKTLNELLISADKAMYENKKNPNSLYSYAK